MAEYDMPQLPAGHPIFDGKVHRFGSKKKYWYVVRELTLRSGRIAITGAFGFNQGENHNSVPIKIDAEEMTVEDRTEYVRQQRAAEQAEEEKREEAARLAAGRARDQWNKAEHFPIEHPYLVRKQVPAEGLRVSQSGELLVPLVRDGKLMGLQKVDGDGNKLFNKGADTAGGAHELGALAGAAVIALGEGYATCASARLSVAPGYDLPAVVGFNAGNLTAVAKALRRRYPLAHLLMLADDDYLLAERYATSLREIYKVSVQVPIDGATHRVTNADGDTVEIMARWRKDAQNIEYIEADVRKGRAIRTLTFTNAGVASCHAAAAAVGNASVAVPIFSFDRAGRKITDFNDLHVEEGLETVAAQIGAFLLAAEQRNSTPSAEPAQAVDADEQLLSSSPFAAEQRSSGSPAPSCGGGASALGPPSAVDQDNSLSPPPPLGGAPRESSMEAPATSADDAEQPATGMMSLEWALRHCALVKGSTDVWDSLNRLKMKRRAFIDTVGKDNEKAWSSHVERRSIDPRNLPKTVRGVALDNGGAGDDNIVMMLDRYTLLYGTKTVWDADKRSVIAYDAMALARGSELATRWLGHRLRREIDLDKLVFDPTQRVDLDTHINMFEGFPLVPKKDARLANLVLALLYSLCSSEANDEEVFDWVLKWLAYPLQHPGAKMQTAMLFFGEKQGTGKSLFFEGIVKPIYGAHGATGGQNQLEAQYTHWRSQKLFVLFEEILNRQDKYSHFGLIKHMITGRDMQISQKFKDDRTEANHLNVVMLSNEFQAVPIEPEDRRFQVVEARAPLDEQLRLNIKSEIDAGVALSQAFYAFLLEYPLDDFDPHTKPVMTDSKQRMINFGRPDWEAFYLTWAAEELNVPYCSCLSEDLYVVYSRWCSRFGYRSLSLTKFSELIAQRLAKDRQWVTLGAASKKKLLTVFHVPQPEGEEPKSLSKRCDEFRMAAEIKGTV
jgi:phage/plasmid primase-like uncharacterized protein